MTYSDLLTDNNTADIMILSQNVTIRANFSGKWELPDGSSLIGKLIQIELFTRNLAGLYKFYIVGLEGTEILAIQIEITAIGELIDLSRFKIFDIIWNNIFLSCRLC